jgi:DUF4097 and DUF4098 domain-containing protein YvlB
MISSSWTKYSFACDPDECDTLIEVTCRDFGFPNGVMQLTCPCGRSCQVLSVVDATILPITQQKEEPKMETITEPQTMTLNWIENDVERTETYTENDIRAMYWNNKNLAQKQNEWYKKESQLRTLLEEVYADSEEQVTLSQIAEIFDVSLTKEIEVTAWVRVDMTIEVDMADGDYDIEDMVRNNLTIDSFGSEISVNDYDVDRVEEGAY